MGFRHISIIDGEYTVKGIITRSDMDEHRLEHFWHEEGEQMLKEMNIDTLPTAIAFETRDREGVSHRRRASSVQSNHSVETVESEIDIEILVNDLEVSESPRMAIRKRIAN